MVDQLNLTSVLLADGSTLSVEISSFSGSQDIGIQSFKFDGLKETLKSLSRELGEVIAEVAPKKASIEFGVQVGVEAGQLTAILVKGSSNATIKVSLEWEKD